MTPARADGRRALVYGLAQAGEAGLDEAVRGVGHSADEHLTAWAAVRCFTFDRFDAAQALLESL